jgi:DNA gyrase/topoisomerase IV subunit B
MVKEIKRKTKVSEAKIEEKDQRWHTRNRITLVFGSNDLENLSTYLYDKDLNIEFKELDFHQAKSKAIEELLDNCIDEFYRGHVTEVHVELKKDKKTVVVQDNGIGFPVNKIVDVYSKFRTGSKFKDEGLDKKGFLNRTLGQNGLGAAATCLTSDYFKATVRHHNSKKEQTVEFIDGALKTKNSKVKKYRGASGVKIELQLSTEVYKDNIIDEQLLRKRIIDLTYNNPGLVFYFNEEKFVSKKGLSDLAMMVDKQTGQTLGEDTFIQEVKLQNKKGTAKGKYDVSISVAYETKSYEKEKFISFVNSTPTYDGGFHHDRVKRIFINEVKEKLKREASKNKVELMDSDIVSGLVFIIGIIMPNPRFESQTKRKLVRDWPLEKSIEELIKDNIVKFFKRNKEYLEAVIERAKSRNKFEVLKDASKIAKKVNSAKIAKLLDANERKDRSKCSLFICEGDSAIGGLRSSRDKLYHGGIALKGKPMNVLQASLNDILNNKEFTDIMGSIGLTLGQKAEGKSLRFANIVFLADSDVDGGHINTLLTNFFYRFWPELFHEGRIQVTKAPLFEVVTSTGKRLFAESDSELANIKKDKRVTIKNIMRNKGLGEMSDEAWTYILSKDKYTVIYSNDKEESTEMLDICFGKDAQARKDLLLASNKANPSKSKKITKKKVTKK